MSMKLKWHGTASVEIISDGSSILFDPFIPLKGSPVNVSAEDFDGFSDILITHGHFDHIVNLPLIVERNPDVKIYCTSAPYKTLLKKGVPNHNIIRIDFGQILKINGFRISTFHGRHAVLPKATLNRIKYILKSPVKSNLPYILRENRTCKENDETVFYHIEYEGKTVSVMGSLNLRDDICYPTGADLLVLPYNGWEDNFPPAVKVIERLKPKRIVLDHYDDTFPPLTMPLDLSPVTEKYGEMLTAMSLDKIEII